jgi:DNA invertase Pin-like site-specific DNA recombinase
MSKPKTVALYLRVSTGEQTVENQRRDLEAAIERRGWRVVAEFCDEGVSGANGRHKRPGFDRLHRAITRRQFDIVAAWSVNRLGRSLQDLVGFLGELHGAGVDLYLDCQGVDTSTPAGKALFQMLGVFAEFERSIIQERIAGGIARARATGTRSGQGVRASARRLYGPRWRPGPAFAGRRLVGTGNATVARIAAEMQGG